MPQRRIYLSRYRVERHGLIALFTQSRPFLPLSADWLASHSIKAQMRASGLWNMQGVTAAPLTAENYRRLEQLVRASRAEMED